MSMFYNTFYSLSEIDSPCDVTLWMMQMTSHSSQLFIIYNLTVLHTNTHIEETINRT